MNVKSFLKAKNEAELKWRNDNFEKLLTFKELFEELEESRRIMLENFFENYKEVIENGESNNKRS